MDGIIWRSDHEDPLTWYEYQVWMKHPLPMGWTIIAKPSQPALTTDDWIADLWESIG